MATIDTTETAARTAAARNHVAEVSDVPEATRTAPTSSEWSSGAPTSAATISPAGRRRATIVLAALGVAVVVALVAGVVIGSQLYSPAEVFTALFRPADADPGAVSVVRTVRVPRTIAAALAGAALAVAGTQMQTVFRNPLADPFVLGVTSGSSFAVAVVVLAAGTGASTWVGGLSFLGDLGIAGAALVGALATTVVALAAARRVRGVAAVLVVGVMIGAVFQALVSIMTAAADPVRLQQFVKWGAGNFRGVTPDELWVLVPPVIAGLLAAAAMTKHLDALLLGESYAASMGVNVRRTTFLLLVIASVLAGTVTAFCGPIGFVGVAAPHLARPLLKSSAHRVLLPAAAMVGVVIAIVAELVAQLPGREGVLPLNAVTALIGAPVVVWVLVRRDRSAVVT